MLTSYPYDMDQVREELQQMLRANTVPRHDSSQYPALVEYIKVELMDRIPDGADISRFALALVFEAALRPGPVCKNDRGEPAYPLRAAKHLLALGEYPEDVHAEVPDTAMSLYAIKNLDPKNPIKANDPRGPHTLGLRAQVAALASKYGESRGVLLKEGSKRFGEVVTALQNELHSLVTDPNIVEILEAKITNSDVWVPAEPSNDEENFRVETRPEKSKQVPRDVDAFPSVLIGRDESLGRLEEARDARVLFVSGPAGVGKTSFAIALSHRLADSFLDGQIQIDLHGYSNQAAVTTDHAMRSILLRLGYVDQDLPSEHLLLLHTYRSVLSTKKIIILLDNVIDAQTVLDLLPGQGGVVLIVTSRRRMPNLLPKVAIASEDLGTLSISDAREVLRRYVGHRVDSERRGAETIAEACDGIPLALNIVGARLATRPRQSLLNAAGDLTMKRILSYSALTTGVTIGQIFEWSLALLNQTQLELLVGLASSPLKYFSADMADAIGHKTSDFDQIANENLLISTEFGDAFVIPDLMRVFISSARVRSRLKDARTTATAKRRLANMVTKQAIDLLRNILTRRNATRISDLPSNFRLRPPGRGYPTFVYKKMLLANLEGVADWHWSREKVFEGAWVGLIAASTYMEIGDWHRAAKLLLYMLPIFKVHTSLSGKHSNDEWSALDDNYRQAVNDLYFRARLYAARSGWTQRVMPISVHFGVALGAAGYLTGKHSASPRNFYGTDSPENLWLAVQESNEILSLAHVGLGSVMLGEFTSEELWYPKRMNVLYDYENRAMWSLIAGNKNQAIGYFGTLYSIAKDSSDLPSIDLLWSVEPPLIRYAFLLLEGHRIEAIEVLNFVERLYAARRYSDGHREVVALLIAELTDSAACGTQLAESSIELVDMDFSPSQDS